MSPGLDQLCFEFLFLASCEGSYGRHCAEFQGKPRGLAAEGAPHCDVYD